MWTRRGCHVRRGAAVALVLVIAAVVLAACGSDPAPALKGVRRDPPLDVSAVVLPDVSNGGTEVAMRAKPGGLLLTYFGYTSCPDICPTTMNDISVALGEMTAQEAARVEVALVTVDPDRDTARVLSGYLEHFFDPDVSHGLRTDDPARLDAAKAAFGVQSKVEPHAKGDREYEVAHTAITYAVDERGQVVVEWPFGTTPEVIQSDLELLLSEAES